MDKNKLRQIHLQKRIDIPALERHEKSRIIAQKAIEVISAYDSIGLYMSTEFEVCTSMILSEAWRLNKRVCIPKIIGNELIFVDIKSLDDCEKGPLGILQPTSNLEALPPSLQIIPMLAFNSRGYRLGYGKGYYDRYLAQYSGFRLGLCFKFNAEEELYESAFDISCQLILTD